MDHLNLPLVPDVEASPHSRDRGSGVYELKCRSGRSSSVEWLADSSNLPSTLPPVTLGERMFGVESLIPKANQRFLKAYPSTFMAFGTFVTVFGVGLSHLVFESSVYGVTGSATNWQNLLWILTVRETPSPPSPWTPPIPCTKRTPCTP